MWGKGGDGGPQYRVRALDCGRRLFSCGKGVSKRRASTGVFPVHRRKGREHAAESDWRGEGRDGNMRH